MPRHQSHYTGSTLKVVYGKPKTVGFSLFFNKKVEILFFCIRHLYSGIYIFSYRKYSEKSKVYHIMIYNVKQSHSSLHKLHFFENDAQLFRLRQSFVLLDLYHKAKVIWKLVKNFDEKIHDLKKTYFSLW